MVTALSGNHHRLDFLIGPGKALDTDKYFIVCTDAIGTGLTTSPSNSPAQPQMKFPRFVIRDMVTSQYKLLTEHLGIQHVVTVIGPWMGGMQALQWGVSYPDFMDSLVALVPLARTLAWTVTVLEATRTGTLAGVVQHLERCQRSRRATLARLNSVVVQLCVSLRWRPPCRDRGFREVLGLNLGLDDRFHESNHIGCHRRFLASPCVAVTS
jgi:pimeloyl-ACP methyl ester carboxylesterase